MSNKSPKMHPATKTIKKATPKKTSSKSGKKYKTYDKTTKEKMIGTIMELFGLKTFNKAQLLEEYEEAEVAQKNDVVVIALTKHVATYQGSFTTEELKKLRRQVKDWIESSDKPETRGGVLIKDDMLTEVKDELIQVLQELEFRSFKLLRPRLIRILEEIHYRNPDNRDKPFPENTCSKHFWYDFKDKHSEIKEMYESIVKVRGRNQTKKNTTLLTPLSGQEGYDTACSEEICSPSSTVGSGYDSFDSSTPSPMEEEEEKKEEDDFLSQPETLTFGREYPQSPNYISYMEEESDSLSEPRNDEIDLDEERKMLGLFKGCL